MEFGGVSNSQKNIPKRINNVSKDGKQLWRMSEDRLNVDTERYS